MNTAEMAGREFDAEKWNVKLLDAQTRQVQLLVCKMEFNGCLQVYIDTGGEEKVGPTPEQMKLRVPRRPSWQGLSPEQLKEVYIRPNFKLNSTSIFRRKTKTFLTGGES